jgi:hypothetical protein
MGKEVFTKTPQGGPMNERRNGHVNVTNNKTLIDKIKALSDTEQVESLGALVHEYVVYRKNTHEIIFNAEMSDSQKIDLLKKQSEEFKIKAQDITNSKGIGPKDSFEDSYGFGSVSY